MKSRGGFRILVDTYVTEDSGTGVVHQAPYFGEVCLHWDLTTSECLHCGNLQPFLERRSKQSLTSLLQQLPPPFILMGDFNARHPLWGSSKLNLRGQVVENILLHNNISVLNSKQSIYIHPATGSLSNIDLTLCSPSIAIDFSWNPQSDTYGSDHFPILLYHSSTTLTYLYVCSEQSLLSFFGACLSSTTLAIPSLTRC